MKRNVLAFVVGTAVVGTVAWMAATAAPRAGVGSNGNGGGHGRDHQSRVWVQFKPGAKGHASRALSAAGARFHYSFDDLESFVVSVPAAALNGLRHNPNIVAIEEDQVRYPMAQSIPYGIDKVQAREVWDANLDGVVDAGAPTGAGIKVCVIDSGIRRDHEDFAGIGITGYPAGWDTDTCGHGTHVAGTIAAANNGTGVVGVSPGAVSLHIIKVFDGYECKASYSSNLIDAANRCQQAGAKIINMSLGGSGSSYFERLGFDNLKRAGVLSIAAAGNDGNTKYSYPASYASVVSVANVDENDAWNSTSQYNRAVDIAAPGTSVLSTYPVYFNPLQVDTAAYEHNPVTGAALAQVSSTIVDGGRCTASGSWSGRIVLCERGDGTFLDKVDNAIAGGAVGVVIYNNVADEALRATLGDGVSRGIPAVGVTQADGQAILAAGLGKTTVVDAVPMNSATRYAKLSGTSMATPHVAGAAALVWSSRPSATNTEVMDALLNTARDIEASGYDTKTGWGLVQAADAIEELNQ